MPWDPSVALCVPLPHQSSSPVGCGPHTYCVPLMTAYPPVVRYCLLSEEVTALTTEPRRVAQWVAESCLSSSKH